MKNAVINTARLKEARLYRKLTMEELANSVGANKQAISQFENGKARPEPTTLKKIVDTLDFPYSFFCQQDAFLCKGNTYFRALYSSSKKDLAAQQIRARYLTQIHEVLSEKVKFPSLDLPQLPENCNIEEAAMYTRNAWNLGEAPIPNMVALLERHGIVVGEFSTDGREIDAFYQYNEINGNPVFCVVLGTDKASFFRRQFNCAHELGHILLHERYEDLDSISREDYRKREDQANAFAAAFLMPKNSFGKDAAMFPNRLSYYIELKKKWGVSIAAMVMRARNLEIITVNQYTYLMRQISLKGYRASEPLDGEIEYRHPKALHQAVDCLTKTGNWSGYELLQWISSKGLALSESVLGELLNIDPSVFKVPSDDKILVFRTHN